MSFQIHQEQLLAYPQEQVFRFFASAENLNLLTPPGWVQHPDAAAHRDGGRRYHRVQDQAARLPLTWRSEITEWQPPLAFCDEQRRGPYRYWIHRHTFEERIDGTLVTDHVDSRRTGRGADQPALRRGRVAEDLRLPEGEARGAVSKNGVTPALRRALSLPLRKQGTSGSS